MTDRELLELAAKAAGYVIQGYVDKLVAQPGHYTGGLVINNDCGGSSLWNPLADDGDALRLAVKLEMLVEISNCYYVNAMKENIHITEHIGNDGKGCIYAATRRAIVRASAGIGRTIQ